MGIGEHGAHILHVLKHVEVEPKLDLEHAIILLRHQEVQIVLVIHRKALIAIRITVLEVSMLI